MRLSNGEVLLHWPLDLHVITAGWYYSDGSSHQAIDLRTNQNGSIYKEVKCAEKGTVDWVQKWDGHSKTGNQSYGNLIRVTHENYNGGKLQTYYAHLSEIRVKEGDTVEEGQVIGISGESGNVNGAHLHFEVRLNSVRRNPLNWLDANFTIANQNVKLGTFTSVINVDAGKDDPTVGDICRKGIDVSKYQGDIDWNKVKAAGIEFAMIRIVSTNNSGVYIDPYFEKNYNGAKAAGIPVGAYIYTYAKTEERQNQEILLAMDALNGKTLEYPLALDVEDSSLVSMGKDALSNLVQRGLVIIDQKGYVPMLYTYTNYTTHLNMATLSDYDLWIADYRGYNGYGPAEMWQYTSSGSVDGISGNVDLNYCYKDFYTPPTVDEDPDDGEEEETPPVPENPPEETPEEPEDKPEDKPEDDKDEDISSGVQSNMQILTIGPMSTGDATAIMTLAQDLGVTYISTYTNDEQTLQKCAIGLVSTGDATKFWNKAKELGLGYESEYYVWPDTSEDDK